MAEVNHIRVNEGESIELPSNINESAVSVSEDHSDWLYVVEYDTDTTQTYTRHTDVVTANPNPPKASDVIVLRHDGEVFDYLEPSDD